MSSAADMIKRFRQGKPMPRSERLKNIEDGEVDEMWWLKDTRTTKAKTSVEPRGGGKSHDNRNYDNYSGKVYKGREDDDLSLSASASDFYSSRTYNRNSYGPKDPKLYSFDDDEIISKIKNKKKIEFNNLDDEYDNSGGKSFRFNSSLNRSVDIRDSITSMRISADEHLFRNIIGSNKKTSIPSPYNSVETLGSTGFKGTSPTWLLIHVLTHLLTHSLSIINE